MTPADVTNVLNAQIKEVEAAIAVKEADLEALRAARSKLGAAKSLVSDLVGMKSSVSVIGEWLDSLASRDAAE